MVHSTWYGRCKEVYGTKNIRDKKRISFLFLWGFFHSFCRCWSIPLLRLDEALISPFVLLAAGVPGQGQQVGLTDVPNKDKQRLRRVITVRIENQEGMRKC